MQYYKDALGKVYAYDDLQTSTPAAGLSPISEADAREAAIAAAAADPAKASQITSVSRAQGKAMLIRLGLWDQVTAYVDAIADSTQRALALVALNDTTEWQRKSPFLQQAAAALGLSDAQMDELFLQAARIEF